jgi:hypothetical protein
MTASHLTPVVHRRVFNCYLVREEDGLTLVDTGPSSATPVVLSTIRRLGAPRCGGSCSLTLTPTMSPGSMR